MHIDGLNPNRIREFEECGYVTLPCVLAHNKDRVIDGHISSYFSITHSINSCHTTERIWLYDNMLTGTPPIELGNLFKLQQLELEANALTGAIPEELCLNRVPLGLLGILEADCAEQLECSCCTCCQNCVPYGYDRGRAFGGIGGR